MATFLFDEIIFGPVKSRRLGVSLGINLLPTKKKICNFDCIYCECGWTRDIEIPLSRLPSREEVYNALDIKLTELKKNNHPPDVITYAGNGEPTLHPDFPGIIDDVYELRDRFFPNAKIAILSNASRIHKPHVKETLLRMDDCILKLDAGSEEMFHRINRPSGNVKLADIVDELISFKGKLIIQTLLLRGEYNGERIDNASDFEIDLWLEHLKKINPQSVMIYCIDRATPARNLEKVSDEEMETIAEKVRALGIKAEVFS